VNKRWTAYTVILNTEKQQVEIGNDISDRMTYATVGALLADYCSKGQISQFVIQSVRFVRLPQR
jgi:hypothetical protein